MLELSACNVATPANSMHAYTCSIQALYHGVQVCCMYFNGPWMYTDNEHSMSYYIRFLGENVIF